MTEPNHTTSRRIPRPVHPKKIRMVALDLDGTLLTSRKSITPITHAAVRAVIETGVKVVLATARPPRSVRSYYSALKLDTVTVNYNGCAYLGRGPPEGN